MESRAEDAPQGRIPIGYEAPSPPVDEPPADAPPTRWGGDAPDDQEPRPHVEDKPYWRRAGGLLIAAALIIAKFGAKLKGLLLLLPKLKLFTTSASMLVSIGAYALLWGWKFGVGIVLLLLIHELGHAWQAKREGLPVSAPVFIPLLGAAILMKRMPDDAAMEARIGLAGPILGTLGCLVPLGLYGATGDPFFLALTFVGFLLNLFNLVPVLPLDGGRAMSVMSPWVWVVAFGIFLGVTLAFPNFILILVLLFGGLETWRRFRMRNSPEGQRYRQVSARTRLTVGAVYVGLVVVLAAGMSYTFVEADISGGSPVLERDY